MVTLQSNVEHQREIDVDDGCRATHAPPAPLRSAWLADLGLLAAGMGMASIEDDVELLVEMARAGGVDSAAVAVLADRAEPEVVRSRALAHVSAAVCR